MRVTSHKRFRLRLDESRDYYEVDMKLVHMINEFPKPNYRTLPEHPNRKFFKHIWKKMTLYLKASINEMLYHIRQATNFDNMEKRCPLMLLDNGNDNGRVRVQNKIESFSQHMVRSLMQLNELEALNFVRKFSQELNEALAAKQQLIHSQ